MARRSISMPRLAAALMVWGAACADSPSGDLADEGVACDSDNDCNQLPGWCDDGVCHAFEGGDEGEGEQYSQAYLWQDDGAGLVETPLNEGLGVPLAAMRAGGVPVVFSAESDRDELSGALLAHFEPLGAAPSTERFDGAIPTRYKRAHAVAADLDLDGDEDLVAIGELGFSVLLDDGGELRLGATQAAELRTTSVAVVDHDEDGVLDAYLPGLTDAYWRVRVVDGIVEANRQVRQWTLGHYAYCAASFAGAVVAESPVLIMVGRVCGGDETITGWAQGPDRLYLLDAAMNEVASIDLGTEGGPAITLRGSTAFISAPRYAPEDGNDGEAQGTLAVEVTATSLGTPAFVAGEARIVAFADFDGDGVDTWIGHPPQEPSDNFVILPSGRYVGAIGDVDDDGRDELFLHRWAWRAP
jgi:hypothetical protein